MSKSLRIAITKTCNLSCTYCCMEYDWVKDKFTAYSDIQGVPNLIQYDSYCITGGEPLLYLEKTLTTAKYLKEYTGKKVYLYTNGLLLTDEIATQLHKNIDGVTVGIHDNLMEVLGKVLPASLKIPIRLSIWEKELTESNTKMLAELKIPYTLWTMDDCDITYKEDWISV